MKSESDGGGRRSQCNKRKVNWVPCTRPVYCTLQRYTRPGINWMLIRERGRGILRGACIDQADIIIITIIERRVSYSQGSNYHGGWTISMPRPSRIKPSLHGEFHPLVYAN